MYMLQEKIVRVTSSRYHNNTTASTNSLCTLVQIYIPRVPGTPSDYPYFPDAFNLDFEDIWIKTDDNVHLNCWLMWNQSHSPEVRKNKPVVMFFQENAGNMAFRLPFLQMMTRILDCNTFILSYRGYGRSQGSPSEHGLKIDAQAALDHILQRQDIDNTRIVLMGRSLGGAVAIHTAAANKDKIRGVIIENTFFNIQSLVPHLMPLLGIAIGPGRPFNFLLRNNWYNNVAVSRLKDMPALFLSAQEDEMIPHHQMKALYSIHGKHPWLMVPLDGARHIDAYETHAAHYWPVVKAFVTSVTDKQPKNGGRGAKLSIFDSHSRDTNGR